MTPLRPLLRPLRRLHRQVRLHRRPLAALSVGTAVLLGLQVTSPPPAPTVAVWTASHDLPSGSLLTTTDLTPVRLPPDGVPDRAVRDLRELLGRPLAAPVARGETLTGLRVLGPGLLDGYPGRSAVPLRITDAATVALLRVGDRVSFVVADPDGRTQPTTLVADVPVVAIPREQSAGFVNGIPGRLVVAAVPAERAAEVAARAATGILIPVWSR